MRKNPVLENEMKRYTRNMKCAWIILGVNLVLALFALIAQMGLSGRKLYDNPAVPFSDSVLCPDGIWSVPCHLYTDPGTGRRFHCGERERKTLDLLLTTHLSPLENYSGKTGIFSLPDFPYFLFDTSCNRTGADLRRNYPGKSVPADPESCHHRYIYRKYRYLLFGDHAQNYGCGDFKLCDGGTSGARNGGYPVWNRLYSADAGMYREDFAGIRLGGLVYLLYFNPAVTLYGLIGQQTTNAYGLVRLCGHLEITAIPLGWNIW